MSTPIFGDPYGNRTHVFAVRGRCLNRLTNGPSLMLDYFITTERFCQYVSLKNIFQKTYFF